MKVNRLSPDVYEIEDFVTVEEQRSVLEYCKSLSEDQWWSEDLKETFWYGKHKNGQLPIFFDKINENVKNLFSSALDIFPVTLQRYTDEKPMQVHRDYWLKDLDYYIRYGIVIYYNDDYVGGEIEYPELNIVHKPKARSLVMHGGNILHGPRKVDENCFRYFSTTFIRGSIDTPVILNPDLFADIELHDGSNYP
jgi:hypothetical protein